MKSTEDNRNNPYATPVVFFEPVKAQDTYVRLIRIAMATLMAIAGSIFMAIGFATGVLQVRVAAASWNLLLTIVCTTFLLMLSWICFEFAIRIFVRQPCRNGMYVPLWAIIAISVPSFIALVMMTIASILRWLR